MTSWNGLEAIRRAQESAPGNERRTAPRFGCRETNCGKGAVRDLSSTGIRVVSTGHPTRLGATELVLDAPGQRVRVAAEPVWSRRVRRGEHEVGYRLLDPQSARREGLFRLAWNPTMTEWTKA